MTGVKETSEQAAAAFRQIMCMFDQHKSQIERLARASTSVLRVYQHLQRNPIVSIPATAGITGLSAPTVAKSLENLQKLGIVHEITGRERHRLFIYQPYLTILNEGTEPL